MKKTKNQPVDSVTLRNVTIPIYERADKKNGTTYRAFIFTFTDQGKRKQKRSATIEAAKAEALKVIRDQTEHQPHNREISLAEFADWSSAMQMLRQHPGAQLAQVVSEWSSAKSALGDRGTINEAVASHLRLASQEKLQPILISDLVTEFLGAKSREGVSERYYGDCRVRLARFSGAFRCHIAGIKTADLQRYLDKVPGGSRTKKNHATGIRTLFEFAKKRGYLHRHIETEATHLTVGRVKESDPGIYTPATFQRVLDASTGMNRLAVALAAFTGMRSAELHRLEWSDVKADHIVVSVEKSKTASRRIVPILAGLRDFLATVPRTDGRIFFNNNNEQHFSKFFLRAFREAGLSPVQNGFRHSFASYRLALVKSADAVALEMGNSPRKLFSNYRELVTEQDAQKWFAVRPAGTPGDIIPITSAAA